MLESNNEEEEEPSKKNSSQEELFMVLSLAHTKARTWPWLACLFHVRSTAEGPQTLQLPSLPVHRKRRLGDELSSEAAVSKCKSYTLSPEP